MDKLLQADVFPDEEKLLLLIAWFNTITVKNEPSGETVERLIGYIDCSKLDSKFITSLLCQPDSLFIDNRICRLANFSLNYKDCSLRRRWYSKFENGIGSGQNF